jgi:hypothetical protein
LSASHDSETTVSVIGDRSARRPLERVVSPDWSRGSKMSANISGLVGRQFLTESDSP